MQAVRVFNDRAGKMDKTTHFECWRPVISQLLWNRSVRGADDTSRKDQCRLKTRHIFLDTDTNERCDNSSMTTSRKVCRDGHRHL